MDVNVLTTLTQSCSQGSRKGGLTCARRTEEFHDHWNLLLPLRINVDLPDCPLRDANDVLKRVGSVDGKAAPSSAMATAIPAPRIRAPAKSSCRRRPIAIIWTVRAKERDESVRYPHSSHQPTFPVLRLKAIASPKPRG
jgi:hypothetical protein